MVSVIVAIYNVEQYIERCIASIINQTYGDIEILLINDGSTDKSEMICKQFAEMDNRIIIINKKNGGLSSARNAGISKAKGEYILFIDGDDFIHPQMIEILLRNMQREDADLSVCNAYKLREEEIETYEQITYEDVYKVYNREQAIEYLSDIRVVAWNKLYKKKLFQQNKYPEGRVHEDEYMFHRIIYQCKKIIYTEHRLYFYIVRSGSIMAQMSKKRLFDAMYALNDRLNFVIENEWMEVREWAVNRIVSYVVDNYEFYKKDAEVRKYFKAELIRVLNQNKDIKVKGEIQLFIFSPRIYKLYMTGRYQFWRVIRFINRKFKM